MIVLDASVVVDLLTGGPLADRIRQKLAERPEQRIAPHLLDVEVVSAIRSLVSGRRMDSSQAAAMLADLVALPVQRFAHTLLLDRIWRLRHNFTAYDAAYIALAEATDSVLYTMDEKLATGHRARVDVLPR